MIFGKDLGAQFRTKAEILRYLNRVFQHIIEDESLNDRKGSELSQKFWKHRKQMVEEYVSYVGRHEKEYIHQKGRETRFKPWNHLYLMGR